MLRYRCLSVVSWRCRPPFPRRIWGGVFLIGRVTPKPRPHLCQRVRPFLDLRDFAARCPLAYATFNRALWGVPVSAYSDVLPPVPRLLLVYYLNASVTVIYPSFITRSGVLCPPVIFRRFTVGLPTVPRVLSPVACPLLYRCYRGRLVACSSSG